MKKQRKRRLWKLVVFIVLVTFWSTFLFFAGPTYIVDVLGVRNGYLLGFIIAAVGGVSTATSVSYFSIVTALAASGLNPFFLGLIMGAGVSIGDTMFFYLGRTGRRSVPEEWDERLDAVLEWLYQRPDWVLSAGVFVWAGFTPFPNDILTIGTGIGNFEAKQILPFILAGNIVFTTLLALWVGVAF
jgi:membrane protein YqaA with SNARE-associated domain